MLPKHKLLCFKLCIFYWPMLGAIAATHYVSFTGTNNPPYTNWADAATNIQWAVDVATNNETVWVTNGTYTLTNQISITNGIILQGFNGRSNTFINGNYPNITNRCFYIVGNGTNRPTLDGFTITNGYAQSNDFNGRGGGVYIATGNVYNCLLEGNTAARGTNVADWYSSGGGGMYIAGCTVLSCIVRGNLAGLEGGGILGGASANFISNCYIVTNIAVEGGGFFGDGTIVDSTFISNKVTSSGGGLAGVNAYISNCVITANIVTNGAGGGVTLYYYSYVKNSVISNNMAMWNGGAGGGVYLYSAGSQLLLNSLIVNNSAANYGGGVYFFSGGRVRQCLIKNNVINPRWGSGCNGAGVYLNNVQNNGGYCDSCTIVSNVTPHKGGGIAIEGTNNNYSVSNCVVWGNTAAVAGNDVYDVNGTNNSLTFSFTCANYTNLPDGRGNITNNPQFVDFAGGNYRLNANSPCVNAGSNEDWMVNSIDLDGRIRIRYGTVDMGAYETIYDGTIYRMGF